MLYDVVAYLVICMGFTVGFNRYNSTDHVCSMHLAMCQVYFPCLNRPTGARWSLLPAQHSGRQEVEDGHLAQTTDVVARLYKARWAIS